MPTSSFLLTTWEGGGSVPPMVSVARKLIAAGHSVRLMSDACNRRDAEAVGAVFVPWTQAPSRAGRSAQDDPIKDWLAPDPVEGFLKMLDGVVVGPALAYAHDVQAELDREGADLVVSSELLLGVAAGCEARGQRFALLTANISPYPIGGIPPMGPGLPPASTDAERAQHAAIAEQMTALLDQGLPGLNGARTQLGLEALTHVTDQVGAAAAVLLGTSRAFDFAPADLPEELHYVGPQLDLPEWAEGAAPPVAADERPLVAICFSTTFQNHAALLQTVMDAMADHPVKGMATLGPALTEAGLRPPANVTLVAAADHDALMSRASCVITHGGHGTVMRALTHGKPLLVLPLGRDQADNAVRVTTRGAGLTLASDATAAQIGDALGRLLNEPEFARAAGRLGAVVAQDARTTPVVQVLEALAATGGPS